MTGLRGLLIHARKQYLKAHPEYQLVDDPRVKLPYFIVTYKREGQTRSYQLCKSGKLIGTPELTGLATTKHAV